MKGEKRVTSSTTGTFTAKIQGKPDFAATRVSVYFDGEYYHCSGLEEGMEPNDFRTLYFHVKHDPSKQQSTVEQMLYISRSGHDLEKVVTKDGKFTIDFDAQAQHFKMSFHVVIKDPVVGTLDILGHFDLRNK